MLLQDVFLVDKLQVISEGSAKQGPMRIRGIFQRADEANNNKRVYPKKVLEAAVKSLDESIQDRRLVGELDHPSYDTVKLSNASHIITSLRMEGTEVIGEAEILSTPAGKIVEALIKDGIKIGISSRGLGTLSESKEGVKTVNDDFKLLTFDIVADPSTRGAFPSLAESTQNSIKVENTIKKVIGKKLFLSMLENKINEATEDGDPFSSSERSHIGKGNMGAGRGDNSPAVMKARRDAARRERARKSYPGEHPETGRKLPLIKDKGQKRMEDFIAHKSAVNRFKNAGGQGAALRRMAVRHGVKMPESKAYSRIKALISEKTQEAKLRKAKTQAASLKPHGFKSGSDGMDKARARDKKFDPKGMFPSAGGETYRRLKHLTSRKVKKAVPESKTYSRIKTLLETWQKEYRRWKTQKKAHGNDTWFGRSLKHTSEKQRQEAHKARRGKKTKGSMEESKSIKSPKLK